jgi:general secretion pathway protein I
MSARGAGFTLVELLVALLLFGLAALALMRLETASVRQTADLAERQQAELVARNIAVDLLTDALPPPAGVRAGALVNGGRRWRWTVRAEAVAGQPLLRIDIMVQGGGAPALLTVLRPLA